VTDLTKNGNCTNFNAAINQGAFDVSNDKIDENCDSADNATLIDIEGDVFTPETGDYTDTDGASDSQALEKCSIGKEYNSDYLFNGQEPSTAEFPLNCSDVTIILFAE